METDPTIGNRLIKNISNFGTFNLIPLITISGAILKHIQILWMGFQNLRKHPSCMLGTIKCNKKYRFG